MNSNGFITAWWSAGITSAVACKMALEMYDNVELYYIHIDTANPDNKRFKADCENWYGCKIKPLKSSKFKDQFDVIEKTGAVNTPEGAPCTLHLKKQVRWDFEKLHEINLFNSYGFGQQYPYTNPLFPLIEKGITKEECAGKILSAGIDLPEMYEKGYTNNNCIGCVKGGKGYWNKIKIDYPETFNRMSELERKVGYSCINGTFLDELKPNRGRMKKAILPNCGLLCELEFADIPDVSLMEVLKKELSIYDAIKRKAA